ncbi:MAG: L-histidine N(alpha)-methyltransferase [Thermoproteota archaeon]|nr:L-histidine N(alpha)-methyltransferase [Thermoproteota archaeon]
MTLQQNNTEFEEFASDVARCLASDSKHLSPKYLYDKVGSQLFEQICLQPEYYLTRTEASILNKYAPVISKLVGSNIKIIELGSGSSSKTAILLSYLSSQKKRIYYFPIDISSSVLIESERKLKSQFPNASIIGIRSDYDTGIDRAAAECIVIGNNNNSIPYTKLVLFLGSSIGNFELIEAQSLLRSLREKLHTNDFLLIGFDLQKDESVLNAAYNDNAGMTAKFNLNLLARINRELGGNFDLGKFEHCAFYSRERHRIEMHLVSKTDQQLYIGALGKTFALRRDESIHTENSYKYSLSQIAALAEDCGFTVEKNFTDEKRWFDLALFSPS